MENTLISIKEIRSTLDQLRQNPKTRRRFPQELWASILHQTKIYPIEEVCRQLQINPIYLHRKLRELKESAFEFREVVMPPAQSAFDTVTIELRSADGLQAKIQGPFSCLNCLSTLFRR